MNFNNNNGGGLFGQANNTNPPSSNLFGNQPSSLTNFSLGATTAQPNNPLAQPTNNMFSANPLSGGAGLFSTAPQPTTGLNLGSNQQQPSAQQPPQSNLFGQGGTGLSATGGGLGLTGGAPATTGGAQGTTGGILGTGGALGTTSILGGNLGTAAPQGSAGAATGGQNAAANTGGGLFGPITTGAGIFSGGNQPANQPPSTGLGLGGLGGLGTLGAQGSNPASNPPPAIGATSGLGGLTGLGGGLLTGGATTTSAANPPASAIFPSAQPSTTGASATQPSLNIFSNPSAQPPATNPPAATNTNPQPAQTTNNQPAPTASLFGLTTQQKPPDIAAGSSWLQAPARSDQAAAAQPPSQPSTTGQPSAQPAVQPAQTTPSLLTGTNPLTATNQSAPQSTQAAAQPAQPAPPKPQQQPPQKIDLPLPKNRDFYKIMEIMNCEDSQVIENIFREDPILFKIMQQGSNWFSFSQNDETVTTDSAFDQEIRSKCFKNKIKSDVYYVLKDSLQVSRLRQLKDQFELKNKFSDKSDRSDFFEKELQKFKHIFFNHYADQRAQLIAGLKLMLVNLIDEEEVGQPSKLLNDLMNKGLIAGLVNSFLSVPKTLKFYLEDQQYSEQYTFQAFQHLVSEQTQILEIFTILQCHFKIEKFDEIYFKAAQKLIEIIKNTQFQGVFYKNERLVFQEFGSEVSKLQEQFKKISFIFVLSQCLRPLYQIRDSDPEEYENTPLWIQKVEEIKQLQPDYLQRICTTVISLQTSNGELQTRADYEQSLRFFNEVLRILENASINQAFWRCTCICIYQWIILYKNRYQDDEYDDEVEALSKIFSKILQQQSLWFYFRCSVQESGTAEQIIFERINKLKVLSKIDQPNTLDLLIDDHSLFQNLNNIIRDFSEGKLSNTICKSTDFLGRSMRASMDYYNEQNKLKGKSLSIGIDNLILSVCKLKNVIKYLRREVQKSAQTFKRIALLCSSNNLNRQILKVTSECSRLIELIIDTNKADGREFQLIYNLLSIGSEAVQSINFLLMDPSMQREMADEINKLTNNEQQLQRQQAYSYHPLFELFHIARKLQASKQFKNKQAIRIHLNYAQLCSTIMGQDDPLQLFDQAQNNYYQQHSFVKNTLETFLRFQVQEWKIYEEEKMDVALEYQAYMFQALKKIFQKFLFQQSKNLKESPLNQLIRQQLNEINSYILIELLLSNLDVVLAECFFEDIGQKQLSPNINMIGIKNKLWDQNQGSLIVPELLVNLLECWNILIDLYSIYDENFSNDFQLMKQLHQFFQEESYFLHQIVSTYQIETNSYVINKVKLNFVHSILGLLTTVSQLQSNNQDPPDFEDLEQQKFKKIYDDMKLKNYCQILDRNVPNQNTIFSSALRLLSKPILNHGLEQSITTIEIEENQLLNKRQHYHHLIFQSLHTILHRLGKKCYTIEKQEILEFLIISLENNQTFMQYILKSQNPNLNSGIKYFLDLFYNIMVYDEEQDYHLPMLIFVFFNQVLNVNQSRYQSFAKECRTTYAALIIKLCKQSQAFLNRRCEKLSNLFTIENPREFSNRQTGSAIELSVIENCIQDAVEEMVTLEYFLKMLINEMKQDSRETIKAYADIVKVLFQKNFIREWYLFLIKSSDHVQFSLFLKRTPVIQNKTVYNYLNNYIYSYGRDFQIDSNTAQNPIATKKSNIMASWFTQLLATLNQISVFIQFFFSIGIKGSPFSDQYQENLYEDVQLGDSIFQPNKGKEIIEGGIFELMAQKSSQFTELEYAFNSALYFLQKSVQNIYSLDIPQIHEELMIPALEVINQIYWYTQQLVSSNKQVQFITQDKLIQVSEHQITFYKHLLSHKSICNPSQKGKYKQIIITCFHSMLLFLDCLKSNILPEPQDLIFVYHQLILRIDFNDTNSHQQIVQLSAILSLILNIYPQNIELLNKPNDGFYDIINLQIETLKNQTKSIQPIIQSWIDIVTANIPNKIDVRFLKSLVFIADDQIYNSNENGQYNQKHSLWCLILVLVRELLAHDQTQCREILEFIRQHEQRIHSAIIQIDQTQQYQSLRQFTAVTGLTSKQIQSYQQSYMLYFELCQITQLLIEIILCKNIRLQYTVQLDKVIYTFISQYSQQLGYHKKLKTFFTFKPYTLLETKLNALQAKMEPLKQSEQQQLINSGSVMRQIQTPSPHRTTKQEQTSIFDGKSILGGGQRFNPKRDVDNISLFNYICLVEYLRFCKFSIQGIAASMNILEVDRNFQLEDNVWNSFGSNIQNFINFNLDVFTNLSQSEQTNNLIKLHLWLVNNYDFQLQYNGQHQLCIYPTTKEELLFICIQNIIYGFCAELQYLQLREVHRKINFIKDSYNIELQLTTNLSKYAETLKTNIYVKQMEQKELFNESLGFGDGPNDASDSYFNRWKLKFEEKQAEYKKN